MGERLTMMIKRGDIFWMALDIQSDSRIIHGKRPVVVVSNNTANRFSPIVSVIPVTRQIKKTLPTHVMVVGYGLPDPSTILTEQVLSIDKSNLLEKIGTLTGTTEMLKIDHCLCIQLGVA